MPDRHDADADTVVDFKGAVGTRVIIEPEGLGDRFNTNVVGWEKGKFFLVAFPHNLALRATLTVGKLLIVRYLGHDGKICGFETTVQGLIVAPQRFICLEYPKRIISVNLRKADRMYTFLPAKVTVDHTEIPGYIINVSVSGCRFVPADAQNLPADYRDNMDAVINFSIFDREEMKLQTAGVVRRIKYDNEIKYIGIEFKDPDQPFVTSVGSYVETLKKYIGDLFSYDDLS
jgi:hypothetical protein